MARKPHGLVTEADMTWVRVMALPFFKLTEVTISEDRKWKREYPDIWVNVKGAVITVTKAWAKQDIHERRKRLAHELIHLAWGFGHGAAERRRGYFSQPGRDRYTQNMYTQYLKVDK